MHTRRGLRPRFVGCRLHPLLSEAALLKVLEAVLELHLDAGADPLSSREYLRELVEAFWQEGVRWILQHREVMKE